MADKVQRISEISRPSTLRLRLPLLSLAKSEDLLLCCDLSVGSGSEGFALVLAVWISLAEHSATSSSSLALDDSCTMEEVGVELAVADETEFRIAGCGDGDGCTDEVLGICVKFSCSTVGIGWLALLMLTEVEAVEDNLLN